MPGKILKDLPLYQQLFIFFRKRLLLRCSIQFFKLSISFLHIDFLSFVKTVTQIYSHALVASVLPQLIKVLTDIRIGYQPAGFENIIEF